MSEDLWVFIRGLGSSDVPDVVMEQARWCLLDLVGVAAAGSTTALSEIMRGYAVENHGGRRRTARLFFDGRPTSPAGAALANAASIDAMDGHDGHRLTKGHAGVAVLPAALSVLDGQSATIRDLLATLVVGYEVANRAGITLHATAADYHSSGAWNALGAAAVAARALGLGGDATREALGIAEYHAPRAPMMRAIAHPTMVKDSSAWGAHAGVSAALLAAAGFTGAPAVLLADDHDKVEVWGDLGRRWTLSEQYFKPYPVCRWAHPAVEATIGLVRRHDLVVEEIERIEVTSFGSAVRLVTRLPLTTEQAQYSLPFPVAAAAVHRRLDPRVVAEPEQADAQVRRLATSMLLRESSEMTAAFPATRSADVCVVLKDGTRMASGAVTAPGDPEDPLSLLDLEEKFLRSVGGAVGPDRARRTLDRLQDIDAPLPGLLAELYAPANSVRE